MFDFNKDVVLLCLECHNKAQISAQKSKTLISKMYEVPLGAPEKEAAVTFNLVRKVADFNKPIEKNTYGNSLFPETFMYKL